MDKELYFENIPTVGDLYLEDVFNVFEDENILFTCTNEKHELYLCVCYEIRGALKWIINKIDGGDIAKLINKEITINDAFRLGSDKKIRIIFTYENGEKVDFPELKEIEELLPTKGVYLKIDNNIEKIKSKYNAIIKEDDIIKISNECIIYKKYTNYIESENEFFSKNQMLMLKNIKSFSGDNIYKDYKSLICNAEKNKEENNINSNNNLAKAS